MSATDGKLSLKFYVPIRLGRGENNREHPMARAKRVKAEKQAVFLATLGTKRAILAALMPTPCTVTLTRVSPGPGLDKHDNLRGALKGAVDELAAILGVDDRDPRVTWRYEQERGDWGLWVHVSATLAGPVVVERPRPPKKLRKPRDLTDALLNHVVATRREARGERANVAKASRDLLAMAKPAFVAPRGSP